jgi:hypothetical protein
MPDCGLPSTEYSMAMAMAMAMKMKMERKNVSE